jgi:AcrR family transcriptional regulator
VEEEVVEGAVPGAFVPPEPPRSPKSARTRQRILDAAWALFISRGYGGVSMRDIAHEAGLTKTGAYGHFRSKGQLLVEVIRSELAKRDAQIDFSAYDDFVLGVELMYDERYREVRLLEVDAFAAARHDTDVAAGLTFLYRERTERMRDALAPMRDPETVAWIMGALIGGIGMREAIGLEPPSQERLAAALVGAFGALV